MSESAAGEILGTRWRFLFSCLQKWKTLKKKLPILRRKEMLNKECAYKRRLQYTVRKGCDISAVSSMVSEEGIVRILR